MPASEARLLGIDDGPAVLITAVSGPAETAGLRAGDVLTHIDGERMFTRRQAMTLVASAQPGERITIRVVRRDGMPFETEAVLEERRTALTAQRATRRMSAPSKPSFVSMRS